MNAQVTIQGRNKRLLNTLVSRLPAKFDSLFQMKRLPDSRRGACTTYSRILAEVLGEFGIAAEVRPVYMETANRTALAYLEREITKDEAIRRGGRVQIWGDIKESQAHQHAVCYIPDWDVTVDLSIACRASGLVNSYPYWTVDGERPWWVITFKFMDYLLEYAWYEAHPDEVAQAKEFARQLIRRTYDKTDSG